MKHSVKNTLLGIAAFISVSLGLVVANVIAPKPMSDEDAEKLGFYRFDEPRLITEFIMTDHLGEPVGLSNLKGGWSLLFFGFTTCPDVCPTTLSVLNDAMRGLEEPPAIVMVSVDPDRDTPERLAQYVPAFNPAFIGYTGTFDETVALAQQLNIAFGKVPGDVPGSYLVDHSASLVLIDPKGRYAGFIKAPHNASNIQRIIKGLPL
ncbi:MAG: SCO family protein [Candidatus Azotimanducaceae bacterium WSBS_2022_MAG_OTU7]